MTNSILKLYIKILAALMVLSTAGYTSEFAVKEMAYKSGKSVKRGLISLRSINEHLGM